MEHEFFMSMDPPTATHQMKQINWTTRTTYEPQTVKQARRKLRNGLAKNIPPFPLSGAVRMTTKWCFNPGKKHKDPSYRITKPDTDNLQKLLKDEMTLLRFWGDDAQVASELVEKFWATPTGIYIKIQEVEP